MLLETAEVSIRHCAHREKELALLVALPVVVKTACSMGFLYCIAKVPGSTLNLFGQHLVCMYLTSGCASQ